MSLILTSAIPAFPHPQTLMLVKGWGPVHARCMAFVDLA